MVCVVCVRLVVLWCVGWFVFVGVGEFEVLWLLLLCVVSFICVSVCACVFWVRVCVVALCVVVVSFCVVLGLLCLRVRLPY